MTVVPPISYGETETEQTASTTQSNCKTNLRTADEPSSLSQPSRSPKTLETPLLLNSQGRNPTPSWQLLPCICTPEPPESAALLSCALHSAGNSHLPCKLWALLQAHKISKVLTLMIYEEPAGSCKASSNNTVLHGWLGKAMSCPVPWKMLCLTSLLLSWEMLKLHAQMHTRCSPWPLINNLTIRPIKGGNTSSLHSIQKNWWKNKVPSSIKSGTPVKHNAPRRIKKKKAYY